MQYATNRLIDSVWTVAYEMKDDMVVIHSYDRKNPIGYEQERTLPQINLIEDENRIVRSIIINENFDAFRMDHDEDGGQEFVVANQKNVFSYSLDVAPEINVELQAPAEASRYLSEVKVIGVATSNTPFTQSTDQIEGTMRSALADTIYSSLKVANIHDAEQLTELTNAALEKVHMRIHSSQLEGDSVTPGTYEQRISIKIVQEEDAEYPVLTEDALEATNQFKADFPKPFKSFSAVDASLPVVELEVDNDIDGVRNAASVKKELIQTIDPKFTVSVTDQPYDAFLVEIHSENGLVERLPSYQPNFEERYARMLDHLAAPKPEIDIKQDSPSFKP